MHTPQRYPNGAQRYPNGTPQRFAGFTTEPAGELEPVDASAAGFLATVRKAVAGGIVGAITGGAGSAIAAAIGDLTITAAEAWGIAGLLVGGFAVGFAGVYAAPANAQTR